jgi:predicted RNA-binding protein with EMAP domain
MNENVPPISKLVPNLWRLIYSYLNAKELCEVQKVSKIFAKNATHSFCKINSPLYIFDA